MKEIIEALKKVLINQEIVETETGFIMPFSICKEKVNANITVDKEKLVVNVGKNNYKILFGQTDNEKKFRIISQYFCMVKGLILEGVEAYQRGLII